MTIRTLEEIEGERWGPAPADATSLVRRCHGLRTRPLDELTIEDLRILVGQAISLPVLVPIALAVLEADPLAEGDFFPGDLLASVLRVSAPFWADHEALRARVSDLVDGVDADATGLTDDVARFRSST